MLLAGIVGVIALLLVALTRMRAAKGSKARPPLWLNIAQIRTARDKGWAGVSDELDTLLHQQFEERMEKKRAFWEGVAAAERASPGGAPRA